MRTMPILAPIERPELDCAAGVLDGVDVDVLVD